MRDETSSHSGYLHKPNNGEDLRDLTQDEESLFTIASRQSKAARRLRLGSPTRAASFGPLLCLVESESYVMSHEEAGTYELP